MIQKVFGGGGSHAAAGSRSVRLVASLAIILVACFTVVAIAYSAVVKDDTGSKALLGTLATASVSTLVVLAGGKDDHQPPAA